MFITFEGVEGAGKTTQIKNLENYFIEKGRDVLITRQPGGSELGLEIRNLILNPEIKDKPSDLAEMFLYLADRAHHVKTVILPALEKGKIVISDRYVESHIAYQGYARGFDIDKLIYLNSIASDGLKPELTFIFDLDPEIGLNRVRYNRKQNVLDRIEAEKIEFHQKVRQGFLNIAKQDEKRFQVINASLSEIEVKEKILSFFDN